MNRNEQQPPPTDKTFSSSFDDMSDDLPWNDDGSLPPVEPLPASHLNMKAPRAEFSSACKRCGGSGRWGWASRFGTVCLRCNGSGKTVTKTDPAILAANRVKAMNRKDVRKTEAIGEWKKANPIAAAWISKHETTFEFARAMRAAVEHYGTLTAGQQAAVERCVARDNERQALRDGCRGR